MVNHPVSGNKIQTLNTFLTLINRDMDIADCYLAGSGYATIYSRSALDNDNPNEDTAGMFPNNYDSVVLMVADGVGGHADGNAASSIAVREIETAIKNVAPSNADLREAILTGVDKANKKIIQTVPGAASTIAIAEIHGSSVRTYHIGDTEILITGQRGKIKYQTIVHSPVGYAVEAGLLDEGQAILHDERHIVSNVLGCNDMHISVSSFIELAPYDTLLIATDGLFDNLQKQEIIEMIRKNKLTDCSYKLIKLTTERMFNQTSNHPSKDDDLTFILFRLHNDKLRPH